MKCVVLGNGFDLYHDIPTNFNNFKDFLDEYVSNYHDDKYDDNISDYLENSHIDVVDVIEMIEFVNGVVVVEKSGYCWNDFESDLLNFCTHLSNTYKSNVNVRSSYNKKKNDGVLLPLLAKDFLNVKKNLECFSFCFQGYLKYISRNYKQKETMQDVLIDADLILTFNYTRTYSMYKLKPGVSIVHLHGDIDKMKSFTIAFQNLELDLVAAESKDLSKLEDSADYFFKVNLTYMREGVSLNEKYENLKPYFSNMRQIDIVGWSCSNIDSYFSDILLDLILFQDSGFIKYSQIMEGDLSKIAIYRHPKFDDKGVLRARLISLLERSEKYPHDLTVIGQSGKPLAAYCSIVEKEYII